MKTPEELAEEWVEATWDESGYFEHEKPRPSDLATYKAISTLGFLAGYRAAQEQHAGYVRRAEENHAAMEKKISHLADQQGYRDGVAEKLKDLGIEIYFGNRK